MRLPRGDSTGSGGGNRLAGAGGRGGEEGSGGGHAAGEEGICRGGGGGGGGSGGGGPPPGQGAGEAEEPEEPAQGLWGRSPGGGKRPEEVPAAEPEATGRGRRGAEALGKSPLAVRGEGGEGAGGGVPVHIHSFRVLGF